jgi:hypothetical protein
MSLSLSHFIQVINNITPSTSEPEHVSNMRLENI